MHKSIMQASQKQSLFPVFLTVFIDLVGFGIIIPVIAPLLLNPQTGILPFEMDAATKNIILGFLIASFPLAQFFGAPVLGALSDRFGRKKVLLFSLAGTCIGYIVFAIGITEHNIYILFASRMLDGFTGGNLAIIQSSISDLSDVKSRAKNFGIIGMSFGLGFIIGPYIGGALSEPNFVRSLSDFSHINFNAFATPFWFAVLLSFLNIIFVIYQFKETLAQPKSTPVNAFTGFKNLRTAFSLPNLRTLFIVSFLFSFGFNFYTQFFNVYLMNKFDFTIQQIGNFFALIGLCGAISQGIIIRPLIKKYKPATLLRVSLIIVSIGLCLQSLPDKEHAMNLYYVVPLIALGSGITFPNMNMLISQQADAQSQGSIFGMSQSIQSVGFAIPPLLSGFIISMNIHLPILVGASIIFVSWIVFIMYFKPAAHSKLH